MRVKGLDAKFSANSALDLPSKSQSLNRARQTSVRVSLLILIKES